MNCSAMSWHPRPCSRSAITKRCAVYRAAEELGRKIPEELSVVGFADLDFAVEMDPPLTTMRQKPYEIGRLAAKLIMDRISGEVEGADERTTIKVDAELIVRESTAPPTKI